MQSWFYDTPTLFLAGIDWFWKREGEIRGQKREARNTADQTQGGHSRSRIRRKSAGKSSDTEYREGVIIIWQLRKMNWVFDFLINHKDIQAWSIVINLLQG